MDKIFGRPPRAASQDSAEHWVSVSDLMSGLMMVFLFISIALMRHALAERDKVTDVAAAYQRNQVALHEALQQEFSADLTRWNAAIDRDTLSFEFKSPDILFGLGSAAMTPRFKDVLDDFFPRYMRVLGHFRGSIQEVRIEGHTSSQWDTHTPPEEAYLRNMELSQARTRSVLFFVQGLPASQEDRQWIRRNIAAVGLSSSRPVLDAAGAEDGGKSRRVTFRVISNAESAIRQLVR